MLSLRDHGKDHGLAPRRPTSRRPRALDLRRMEAWRLQLGRVGEPRGRVRARAQTPTRPLDGDSRIAEAMRELILTLRSTPTTACAAERRLCGRSLQRPLQRSSSRLGRFSCREYRDLGHTEGGDGATGRLDKIPPFASCPPDFTDRSSGFESDRGAKLLSGPRSLLVRALLSWLDPTRQRSAAHRLFVQPWPMPRPTALGSARRAAGRLHYAAP
jgi:hypothetical protein